MAGWKIVLVSCLSLSAVLVVIMLVNSAGENRARQAELNRPRSPNNLVAYTLTNTILNPRPLYNASRGWNVVSGLDYTDFGATIALHGDKILIGSPREYAGADNSGAAYLFDAVTGDLLQSFFSPTPAIGDRFGYSVAIHNDKVIIGRIANRFGRIDTDAYVFDATNGKLLHILTNPTPNAPDQDGVDQFGSSVAIFGNKVLVGASFESADLQHSGAAYLFDARTGKLLHSLRNPTPGEGDGFGSSVAISGGRALIGADGDDASGYHSGAAYLFDANTGKLLHTLLNPTLKKGGFFGLSVAMFGDTVLITAPDEYTGGKNSGAAYIFDANTGELLRTLLNPLPINNKGFGSAAAISGDRALVGTYAQFGIGRGTAYLFDTTSGVLLHTFVKPTPDDVGYFGPIAIHENKIVVGAQGCCSVNGAYLFSLTTTSTD